MICYIYIGFLRDLVEVLIYILLPANEFRCVPARMAIRVKSNRFLFERDKFVNLTLFHRTGSDC